MTFNRYRSSAVSGHDLEAVRRIYERSGDPKTVEEWARAIQYSEEAEIANAGWIIGGFVRGTFYENLAAIEGLQLLSHPFRLVTELGSDYQDQHEFTNTELALVKILVANALTEPTRHRRVKTWSSTVRRARDYIATYEPDLENNTQAKAEDAAIQIAKKIDLQGGPQYIRTAIDLGLQTGITTVGFKLVPWAGPAIAFASRGAHSFYKVMRGKTPGEDLADLYFKSAFRFRWLARSVPGRIERTLRVSEIDHSN